MWMQRDISKLISENDDSIQVVRGPRQCGKSSLLLKLSGESFEEVSFDDLSLRELAQSDPVLFFKQFSGKKIFIDEAQYAPQIFPTLKREVDLKKRVDNFVPETFYRLTGSNQILMDQNIKESLAGRASFFEMNTLSVREILRSRNDLSIQEILYVGGWPEVHSQRRNDVKKYLDDYVNSYIEKDIVLSAGIQKSREFLNFVRLLAGRVGEILDFSKLGNDVGIDQKTAKEWTSILEKMHVLSIVEPFSTNLTNRLSKRPKAYFLDTGLVCRLQGWTGPGPILTSPQQGHIFENLVFAELYKLNINFGLGWRIYHWRSKDGEEIDFLVEMQDNKFLFIESKVQSTRPYDLSKFSQVKKVFGKESPPILICHQEGERVLANKVPIAFLSDHLLEHYI